MASTEHPFVSETLTTLRSFFELHSAPKYLVAVSGGRDSMLLCELLLLLKLPVELMHVNYGLRGSESDLDQLHIAQYCHKSKLKLHCHQSKLAQQLRDKKTNLQAEARAIRYRFFREIQAKEPGSMICIAQHQDDQIETFWLQLSRGAGLKGLASMTKANNGTLRPLLDLTRMEINALCQHLQLEFRDDSSNQSKKYRRNLWRMEFLPFLDNNLPQLKAAILYLQQKFHAEIKAQEEGLARVVSSFQNNKSITLNDISQLTAYQYIEIFKRAGFPMYITKRISELFTAANGKYLQWTDPINAHLNYLVKNGKKLEWFVDEACHWAYQFEEASLTDLPNDHLIDTNLIKGQLYFRFVQPKDKIKIKGLAGSKSVYQLLKEAGVPAPLRPLQFVCCDDQKVIAIPGHKVNYAVVAKADSSNVAELTFQKILTFEND
ncbi:MAG: tRNA lysidine(34) synthetase TilS [Sphingomonadales bacterium]|nr:tRNA lysidine(34) synthetase TilS [Sphingomonadales bacterium]